VIPKVDGYLEQVFSAPSMGSVSGSGHSKVINNQNYTISASPRLCVLCVNYPLLWMGVSLMLLQQGYSNELV